MLKQYMVTIGEGKNTLSIASDKALKPDAFHPEASKAIFTVATTSAVSDAGDKLRQVVTAIPGWETLDPQTPVRVQGFDGDGNLTHDIESNPLAINSIMVAMVNTRVNARPRRGRGKADAAPVDALNLGSLAKG